MNPGFSRMALGALIFLIGAGVTLATYEAASGGGKYVVAWGAMAVGAVMFITGLMQGTREREPDPVATAEQERQTALLQIDAMMRCMAFIAAADGKIEDSERAMFAEIVERLTGLKLSNEEQRRFFDKAGAEFFDPISFVQDREALLDQSFRRLILKASCYVAMADGSLAEAEAVRLRALGQALKIPRDEYDAIVVALQAPASAAASSGAGSA